MGHTFSGWKFCLGILFSPEIFGLGTAEISLPFQFNRNFRIFWVNGKQPRLYGHVTSIFYNFPNGL